MLVKTEGIVLHTIKHTDSGIIAHILTKDYGRQAFIVKGIHSRRGNLKNVFFQPLRVIAFDMYYREGRNLNSIKEVSLVNPESNIHINIYKNTISMFLSEVLYRTTTETDHNEALYKYTLECVNHLESSQGSVSNFHIGFLVGLSKYLGIAPSILAEAASPYFDMQNGHFCDEPPLHGYYLQEQHSILLHKFLGTTIDKCEGISLSGKARAAFLESILTYYSFHLPGIKNIKSLEVLSQLFT